jgi:hypothetical protein
MTEDLKEELLALERGFWSAATDPGYYEEHVSADGIMVFPYGVGAMTKPQILYTIRANDEEWDSYEFADVKVVSLGAEAAVITYKAVAARAQGDDFKAFVSSTYLRDDGGWLLAFHQQTLAQATVSGE